ncbi:MAG: hypothetical protein ABL911_08420, partial [Gallionella sp.]
PAAPFLISLGIHAGVLGIVFNTDPASSVPSNTGSGLVVHLNGAAAPKITPDGWASPTSPPNTESPPKLFLYNQQKFSTISGACAAYHAVAMPNPNPNPSYPNVTYVVGESVLNQCHYTYFGAQIYYIAEYYFCSPGFEVSPGVDYSASPITCHLINPAAAKKPPLTPCEAFASGGSFSSDPQNDACAAAMGVGGKDLPDGAKAKITPNSITINRSDGSTATVTLNPTTGATTIVEKHPNATTGQTTTTTTDVSSPSSGGGTPEVTGQSSSTSNGTGTQEGASSGNAPQGGDCPSCAKEVTLQQTNSKLDGIASSLNGGIQPTGFGVDPSVSMQQGLDNISAAGNDLPSYSWAPSILPGNAIACKPIPWASSVSGGLLNGASGTGYVDICAQLDLVRQVLGYLFMVGAAIYVFRAFFRANDGS